MHFKIDCCLKKKSNLTPLKNNSIIKTIMKVGDNNGHDKKIQGC